MYETEHSRLQTGDTKGPKAAWGGTRYLARGALVFDEKGMT